MASVRASLPRKRRRRLISRRLPRLLLRTTCPLAGASNERAGDSQCGGLADRGVAVAGGAELRRGRPAARAAAAAGDGTRFVARAGGRQPRRLPVSRRPPARLADSVSSGIRRDQPAVLRSPSGSRRLAAGGGLR